MIDVFESIVCEIPDEKAEVISAEIYVEILLEKSLDQPLEKLL